MKGLVKMNSNSITVRSLAKSEQSEPVQTQTPSLALAGIFRWLSAPRTRLEPLTRSPCPQQYAFKFNRVARPIIVIHNTEQYKAVGATTTPRISRGYFQEFKNVMSDDREH
ncbi:hypothetical protein Taro_050653 [Colocasia esculenta]|uniref:Uncharacterized protein n=1 Tax=Colocasia esculenta TaxID=4460 RepID=A0A843XDZ3_COLES|nr:hypothetical protein [Colocasia esculenta]